MKKGWSHQFDHTIPLPDDRVLKTLRDAGNHVAALPKREHSRQEWQDAMRALMLVIDHGGMTLLPSITIVRTLSTGKQDG